MHILYSNGSLRGEFAWSHSLVNDSVALAFTNNVRALRKLR